MEKKLPQMYWIFVGSQVIKNMLDISYGSPRQKYNYHYPIDAFMCYM